MTIRRRHLPAAIQARNELLDIPNATVISASIVNYSLANIPAATTECVLSAISRYKTKPLRKTSGVLAKNIPMAVDRSCWRWHLGPCIPGVGRMDLLRAPVAVRLECRSVRRTR